MSQVNVTGVITDSTGNELNGCLKVTLDSAITTENSESWELYPSYNIVENGVIDISLEETDSHNITYHFEFYRYKGDTDPNYTPVSFPTTYNSEDYENDSSPNFHAIVPNLPAYPWADLRYQTGISTANMSTAALAVVKAMFADPNVREIIFSGLGFYKGSTPPPGTDKATWIHPETFDIFHYSIADTSWLTDSREISIRMKEGESLPFEYLRNIPFGSYYTKLKIHEFYIQYTQNAPSNGTDKHQINVGIIAPNTTSKTVKGTVSTHNGIDNERNIQVFSDGIIYTYAQLNHFFLEVVKDGVPGDLKQADVTIKYSYVI